MKEIYILIMVITGHGRTAIDHVEFTSKETCVAAMNQVNSTYAIDIAKCVKK